MHALKANYFSAYRSLKLTRDANAVLVAEIEFSSFGNVADTGVWSQVHDEGVQIVET